jgi:hypothetical protein
MHYSVKKDSVREKGGNISGQHPNLYLKDKMRNVLYYPSYGKLSKMGWNIDHFKPVSKGSTHHLNNLHPLNSRENCRKGKEY